VGVLVAICAHRVGLDAWTYAETTTEGMFLLDVEAWVETWATPARIFMGEGKKEPGQGAVHQRRPENAPRRKGQATHRRVVDIDKLDTPATVHQIAPLMAMSIPPVDTRVKLAAERRYAGASKVDLRTWAPPGRV
jgi:hypothetical protein